MSASAHLFPFVAALLLSACSSMSPVQSHGKNLYSVTYNAGAEMSTWVDIKNKALVQAETHCQSLGLKMAHPKIESNRATGLAPKAATVTFNCVETAEAAAQAKADRKYP